MEEEEEGAEAQPICAITGPTHGIGVHIARTLSAQGYHLLLLCRDTRLGEALQPTLHGASTVLQCDLGNSKQVCAAAEQINSVHDRLDVLINNAGTLQQQRQEINGLEAQMVVNHLGHFLLTQQLLPLVQQTTSSRIVITASEAHRTAQMSVADPLGRKDRSSGLRAYSRSKLANLCFALSLAERLQGSNTVCNALHPGVIYSNLMRNSGGWVSKLAPLLAPFATSEAAGARTSIYLASSAQAATVNGEYFNAKQRRIKPSRQARDASLRASLWEASEAALA